MIGKEILSHKPVPLCEVADLLSEREKEGELGFEQKGALDYASKFRHLSKDKCEDLISKLLELPFMSENMAIKLVDTLPKTEEEVILVFGQEKKDITKGQVKEVMEILEKI